MRLFAGNLEVFADDPQRVEVYGANDAVIFGCESNKTAEEVRVDLVEQINDFFDSVKDGGVTTPSQQTKSAGLKSLTQVSQITGVSLNTLTNWHRNKPELFRIVLIGCKVDAE